MDIRAYDPEVDFDGIARIWKEIGWIESGSDDQEKALKVFAEQYDGLVAIIDDSHGVLSLDLDESSYEWRFIDVYGNVRDAGTDSCN